MLITSPVFNHNQPIPAKYTCDGDNINPPLKFSEVPTNAKSLVLLMDDPDIPDFVKEKMSIVKFDHWTIFNLPADTLEIPENTTPLGSLGANSTGQNVYTGPCPPDKQHRYFFRLYALDAKLNLETGAAQAEVLRAIQGHVLSQAELIGVYKRP